MKAVFLGRFQPFHRGHSQVVEQYRETFDRFALAMGSAETARTVDNPLTAAERKDIIHGCFRDLAIVEIADEGPTEEDNRRWVRKLIRRTDADTVISQNSLVKRLVQEYSDAELVAQDLYDPERYSGTEVRRRIRAREEWQHLVPDCAVDAVETHVDTIRETGEG